jgi:ABC-type transporter MlaC component
MTPAICALLLTATSHAVLGTEPATTPATSQPSGAIEAARRYAQALKTGPGIQAITTFWDFPGMLQGVFGEDMKKHTDAERQEMQRLLQEFIGRTLANPEIRQLMSTATFDAFETKPDGNGATLVSFTVHLGDQAIPNAVLMKAKASEWRIIDAGVNGNMMVPVLRGEYQKAQVTPLEYIKAVAAPPEEGQPK